MSTKQQMAFRVLRFQKSLSSPYNMIFDDSSAVKVTTARRYHRTLQETGGLYKGKSLCPPRIPDKNVKRVRQSFSRISSPCIQRTHFFTDYSLECFTKTSDYKPYRLKLLQALCDGNKQRRHEFLQICSWEGGGERIISLSFHF